MPEINAMLRQQEILDERRANEPTIADVMAELRCLRAEVHDLRELKSEVRALARDVSAIGKDTIDLSQRVKAIERHIAMSRKQHEFPDADAIVKLTVQFWNNAEKNKLIRAERASQGKGRGGNLPNQQLEIWVWDCRPHMIGRLPNGTVKPSLKIPLQQPNTKYASDRIGSDLDYLLNQHTAWFGMLTPHRAPRCPDQAARVEHDQRLILSIRGTEFDLGLPKTRPDDASPDAYVLRWDWPDVRRT